MKHRQIINLLYIALPVCVLLRVMQIKFTIDSTTGFIKQQYGDISTLITLVVFAAIVSMCVLSFTTEKISFNKSAQQPMVAFGCVLTGGTYVYETCTGISQINDIYSILLVFLSIISAIIFIAYGLKKIYPYDLPSIVLLVPVVYFIIKLIKLFVSTSTLSLVTENAFLLFTNSAILCFLFEIVFKANKLE